MAMCLVLGVNFGLFATVMQLSLSSHTVHLKTGSLANSPNKATVSFMRPKNGMTSRIAVESAMYSLSVVLSNAMREVIPFLSLMEETATLFGLLTREPVFRCTVWEDNESCITVAKSPKFTPRTKHIAIKYHHFRRFVSDGTILINSIDTTEKIADIFTKPLGEKSFCYLRHNLMGW